MRAVAARRAIAEASRPRRAHLRRDPSHRLALATRAERRALRLELTDRAVAGQAWAHADRWIVHDGAIVPLINPRRVVATSRRLGGWRGGSATGLQSNFWVR